MKTHAEELREMQELYAKTLAKISEACNAVKATKGFANTFAVIACVPGDVLAQFIIMTSTKMQEMAAAEILAQKEPPQDGE